MDESAVITTYPQATNNNAAAVTNGETSSEPVQAYAKLEGESFCYYIRYGMSTAIVNVVQVYPCSGRSE
jgi:hypothetical protein